MITSGGNRNPTNADSGLTDGAKRRRRFTAARSPTGRDPSTQQSPEEWERDALTHLRHGNTTDALNAYQSHDRVRRYDRHDDAVTHLAARWAADTIGRDPLQVIMLAATRAEVAPSTLGPANSTPTCSPDQNCMSPVRYSNKVT